MPSEARFVTATQRFREILRQIVDAAAWQTFGGRAPSLPNSRSMAPCDSLTMSGVDERKKAIGANVCYGWIADIRSCSFQRPLSAFSDAHGASAITRERTPVQLSC